MEAVRFKTYDGVELAANLYLPQGGSEWARGIIVCHGFGSRKENYADTGERAAAAGLAALVMDLRGHGESEGEVDANIFNDVAAALLYLQSRPEVNPTAISIRGASMGGWLAVHTAAYLPDLTSVIAVCPASDLQMSVLMEEVSMVQRGHASPVVPEPPPRVNVNSTATLLYRLDISKVVKRISPRPLLLIHCEGDEVVPAHSSEQLYNEALEPKTLWLLPGGDHHFAQHDPEIDARIFDWLD
jgi:dienelactone hydrolase